MLIIRLDHHLTRDLQTKKWFDVEVRMLRRGCAGVKIDLIPLDTNKSTEHLSKSTPHEGITCWIDTQHETHFHDAQIARSNNRYFLVAPAIRSRCGCGTSFSFEEQKKPLVDLSKVHRIREALNAGKSL